MRERRQNAQRGEMVACSSQASEERPLDKVQSAPGQGLLKLVCLQTRRSRREGRENDECHAKGEMVGTEVSRSNTSVETNTDGFHAILDDGCAAALKSPQPGLKRRVFHVTLCPSRGWRAIGQTSDNPEAAGLIGFSATVLGLALRPP